MTPLQKLIKELEKSIVELAERKVIEFADTINRGSEERAFLRKAIIDVALSSQTNLIKGLIEEVEGMKKYSGKHNAAHTWITDGYCNGCGKKLTSQQLEEEFGNNQALQKVVDYLKEIKI